MKIGIFDSGLGGLFILKSLVKKLPRYDYIYLGDTKNLPYGDKSQKQIFQLAEKAVNYLFDHDCAIVLIACNTASSQALRKLQLKYPNRKILGIIQPTVESTVIRDSMTVGIIGTQRTIDSGAYLRELVKINPKLNVIQKATPKLVPMIEKGHFDHPITQNYLKPLKAKKIEVLILACTHYPIIKKQIREIVGKKIKVISPDELLPAKLKDYLNRHTEISRKLSKNAKIELLVTQKSDHYQTLAKKWFGKGVKAI